MADQSIKTNTAAKMYFFLVDVDDLKSPEIGEAGGQPQVSKNGAAFSNTGVSTLTHMGNGQYYADVNLSTLSAAANDIISGRYKSANTAEAPSLNTIQVVEFSPGTGPTILGPVVGTSSVFNFVGDPLTIAMFQAETKTFVLTVLDANNDVVDISAKSLRFVIETTAATPVEIFSTTSITVSGASNEIANIPISSSESVFATGVYEWKLWDDLVPTVLLHGPFNMLSAS